MSRDSDDGIGIGGILIGLGALAAGGFAAYKAMKGSGSRTPPELPQQRRIYNPSDYEDILNFYEEHIDPLHTYFCRVVPAAAAIVSLCGNIDVRQNNKGIEYYTASISETLGNAGIQTEYAGIFITVTMNEMYSRGSWFFEGDRRYADSYVEIICTWIRRNVNDVGLELLIREILVLTECMNGAAFTKLLEFAEGVGVDRSTLTQLIIKNGYNESIIRFPSLPITVSSVSDICNFCLDPVDYAYSYPVGRSHLIMCRMAPAMAAVIYADRGENLLDNTDWIDHYVERIRFGVWLLDDYAGDFVRCTIKAVQNSDSQRRKDIKELIGILIPLMGDDDFNARLFLYHSVSITEVMRNGEWREYWDVVKCRLDIDGFRECVSDAGYDIGETVFNFGEDDDDEEIELSPQLVYYFGILGVEPDSEWDDVNSAYHDMVRFWHPDNYNDNEKKRKKAEEKMKVINTAFEALREYYGI